MNDSTHYLTNTGIHRGKSFVVILRRAYYELTGDCCAAKLIEYFNHWTEWKLKTHRTPWVYQKLSQIRADMIEHCIPIIRRGLAILMRMGIIHRRSNPGNGQDRTWQYCLDTDRLAELMNEKNLSLDSPKAETRSESPFVINESGSVISESGSVISDKSSLYTQDLTSIVRSTTTRDVVDDVKEGVQEEEVEQHQPSEPQGSDHELTLEDKHLGEGNFSAPAPDAPLPVLTTEISTAPALKLDGIDPDAEPDVRPANIPDAQAFRAAIDELRSLPCTPSFIVTEPIRKVMQLHWSNVRGAIAYTKEAMRTWKRDPNFNWGGLFVAACKEGRKPENWQRGGGALLFSEEENPPTKEQMAQLEEVKRRGLIRDVYFSTLKNRTMVILRNYSSIAWQDYLQTVRNHKNVESSLAYEQ